VLIGAFQWVAGFAGGSDHLYFAVSATALGALAVATVWLLTHLRGANPWLLAAAPAVAFWGVQNWDFLGIFPLVAALLLHQRGRHGWGAFALAVGASAKFFPIVVLPVVVVVRLAQRRWRAAMLVVAVFALVTFALNGPVALDLSGPGVNLRDSWTYFFDFSRVRPAEHTLWNQSLQSVPDVNRASGALLLLGLVGLLTLTARRVRTGHDVLLSAAAVALLWLFATSKLYSAQYAIWIMLALALAAVPVYAAVAFEAVDILFFITIWGGLHWLGDVPDAARQIGTGALALYVALRLSGGAERGARAMSVPDG
jgi:uncharacterized membrane protein